MTQSDSLSARLSEIHRIIDRAEAAGDVAEAVADPLITALLTWQPALLVRIMATRMGVRYDLQGLYRGPADDH
jgi:hypothetical protein